MKHSDFTIGQEFLCGEKRWRCTDKGTRMIVAICLETAEYVSHRDGKKIPLTGQEADAEGWSDGPPYAVAETVFDENDIEGCEPVQKSEEA